MLFEKIEFEASEELIKVVRKHWFIIAVELLGVALVALLPLFAIFVGWLTIPSESIPDTGVSYPALITFSVLLWWVLSGMMAAMAWTHYYLDLWIITDRRIIVIDQVGFFHRKVGSFRLERMQDIKAKVSGIIPTLLNFGTLRAQTASAAESNFTNRGLPDPRGLQALIQRAMDQRLQDLQSSGPHQQNW